MASMALAIARLSASVSAPNNMNDGAMCSGGGSGAASIVERCPLRVHKIQPVVEADFAAGADARIKIREIRAAAQRHVLAVVHFAAVRQRVGSGAPAQVRTLFDKANAAGPLQPARRRRTAPPGRRRSPERFARASPSSASAARPAVRRYWIFSALESETREPKTRRNRALRFARAGVL